jgi:hypothetical protein
MFIVKATASPTADKIKTFKEFLHLVGIILISPKHSAGSFETEAEDDHIVT